MGCVSSASLWDRHGYPTWPSLLDPRFYLRQGGGDD